MKIQGKPGRELSLIAIQVRENPGKQIV